MMTRLTNSRRENNSSGRLPLGRCSQVLLFSTLFIFVWFYITFHSGLFTNNDLQDAAALLESLVYDNKKTIRVAFIGNSLLFTNDSPGLIVAMAQASGIKVEYDACLRGGATLSNIGLFGFGGCDVSFQTSRGEELTLTKLLAQKWDCIIMHDQSRAPVENHVKTFNANYLNRTYAEPILKSGGKPIFMQTAGYRYPPTQFEFMTKKLREGYEIYAEKLTSGMSIKANGGTFHKAQIAPVGEAFAKVYQTNQKLWSRLYVEDGVHPSALGTWLQACVLYTIITGAEPPEYKEFFWETPTGRKRTYLRLPTEAEAKQLRAVAIQSVELSRNTNLGPLDQ